MFDAKLYSKNYRATHKDEIQAYKEAHREEDRQYQIYYQYVYRDAHRDELRDYAREYKLNRMRGNYDRRRL